LSPRSPIIVIIVAKTVFHIYATIIAIICGLSVDDLAVHFEYSISFFSNSRYIFCHQFHVRPHCRSPSLSLPSFHHLCQSVISAMSTLVAFLGVL